VAQGPDIPLPPGPGCGLEDIAVRDDDIAVPQEDIAVPEQGDSLAAPGSDPAPPGEEDDCRPPGVPVGSPQSCNNLTHFRRGLRNIFAKRS
jgi:hypothetical protein